MFEFGQFILEFDAAATVLYHFSHGETCCSTSPKRRVTRTRTVRYLCSVTSCSKASMSTSLQAW